MENDKLKKLIRKAEVDNTMKRIKMGDFKGRREVHQNNPNFDLGRKPTNPNLNVEGVQKAGHPEAFELGLDKDTTSNTEYQKILRRKRIERAAMMSDPTHSHHETDDVSQDDVEAADRAARRRKRIGEAMEKQGMLFKMQAEPKTTTVVPAVVGDERKRSIDRASKKRMKQIKKYEDLPAPVYGKEAY